MVSTCALVALAIFRASTVWGEQLQQGCVCLPKQPRHVCETCETWKELVLKLVGICVKLVKLVKLGRKISKGYFSSKFHEFHEFHEFHANTNEFQHEFWPSFTSFACLCKGRRLQTPGCTRVGAEQGKSLQSLRTHTKRRCGATAADAKKRWTVYARCLG